MYLNQQAILRTSTWLGKLSYIFLLLLPLNIHRFFLFLQNFSSQRAYISLELFKYLIFWTQATTLADLAIVQAFPDGKQGEGEGFKAMILWNGFIPRLNKIYIKKLFSLSHIVWERRGWKRERKIDVFSTHCRFWRICSKKKLIFFSSFQDFHYSPRTRKLRPHLGRWEGYQKYSFADFKSRLRSVH